MSLETLNIDVLNIIVHDLSMYDIQALRATCKNLYSHFPCAKNGLFSGLLINNDGELLKLYKRTNKYNLVYDVKCIDVDDPAYFIYTMHFIHCHCDNKYWRSYEYPLNVKRLLSSPYKTTLYYDEKEKNISIDISEHLKLFKKINVEKMVKKSYENNKDMKIVITIGCEHDYHVMNPSMIIINVRGKTYKVFDKIEDMVNDQNKRYNEEFSDIENMFSGQMQKYKLNYLHDYKYHVMINKLLDHVLINDNFCNDSSENINYKGMINMVCDTRDNNIFNTYYSSLINNYHKSLLCEKKREYLVNDFINGKISYHDLFPIMKYHTYDKSYETLAKMTRDYDINKIMILFNKLYQIDNKLSLKFIRCILQRRYLYYGACEMVKNIYALYEHDIIFYDLYKSCMGKTIFFKCLQYHGDKFIRKYKDHYLFEWDYIRVCSSPMALINHNKTMMEDYIDFIHEGLLINEDIHLLISCTLDMGLFNKVINLYKYGGHTFLLNKLMMALIYNWSQHYYTKMAGGRMDYLIKMVKILYNETNKMSGYFGKRRKYYTRNYKRIVNYHSYLNDDYIF